MNYCAQYQDQYCCKWYRQNKENCRHCADFIRIPAVQYEYSVYYTSTYFNIEKTTFTTGADVMEFCKNQAVDCNVDVSFGGELLEKCKASDIWDLN